MKYFKTISTALGDLTLVATEAHLLEVLWSNRKYAMDDLSENSALPLLKECEAQIKEYLMRRRKVFDLPISMTGTEFQKKVWKELQKIPFGETASYSELALRLGRPSASRAVGAANGKNPLSIIVPCHRVIGKSGDLTGFAGGMENKAFLLELEGLNHGSRYRKCSP